MQPVTYGRFERLSPIKRSAAARATVLVSLVTLFDTFMGDLAGLSVRFPMICDHDTFFFVLLVRASWVYD